MFDPCICSGYICDDCDYALGGARLVCLDCQPAKGNYYRTIDLCDHPDCYSATVTKRDDLERPHIPEHDWLKIRTVMLISEQPDIDKRAKAALKSSRARFAEQETESSEQGATECLKSEQDVALSVNTTEHLNEEEPPEASSGVEDLAKDGKPEDVVPGAATEDEPNGTWLWRILLSVGSRLTLVANCQAP